MRIPLHSKPIVIGLLFFFFIPGIIYPNTKVDSLLIVTRDENQTIQNRLSAYADLVFHYESSDPEKAIQLGKEGLKLAVPDSLNEDLAMLYVNIAFVYYSSEEYEAAIPVFMQAAELYNKAGKVREEGAQYINWCNSKKTGKLSRVY